LFVLQNRRIREHLRHFVTLRQHSLQRLVMRQWTAYRLLHVRFQTRAKIVHRLFARLVRRLLTGALNSCCWFTPELHQFLDLYHFVKEVINSIFQFGVSTSQMHFVGGDPCRFRVL
jgi:hypothetical protein